MSGGRDELAQARYRRLVRTLELRMRRGVQREGGRGHLLLDRAELRRLEREGVTLARLRRAAREAGAALGWDAATHLDPIGRLSVYDAAPVQDEEFTVSEALRGALPEARMSFG